MITLNELFKVTWNITELSITARNPDLLFLHQWIFGDDIVESVHMRYLQEEGKLTICNEKINYHGEDNGRGVAEIGWGVKEKLIPKQLLEAPITALKMHDRCRGRGATVSCDVEMQELTMMTLIQEGEAEAEE